jgi:acetyl-CoA carboxylase carboxyltransferase component
MVGDLDFGGDALSMIATIADNGVYYEIGKDSAPALSTVFTTFGGVKCGVVATSFAKDEGKLTAVAAKKAADFVAFCDMFAIPVVTIVDSLGLATDAENEKAFADSLARLAMAYASSENAKVTVIAGHAIGASFVLLGSKALGADIVYATDNSEIGALPADSGVAFAWNNYVTEETKREALAEAWKASVASPVAAAATGEIDDIISVNELRARICSSLLMLSAKGKHLAL